MKSSPEVIVQQPGEVIAPYVAEGVVQKIAYEVTEKRIFLQLDLVCWCIFEYDIMSIVGTFFQIV